MKKTVLFMLATLSLVACRQSAKNPQPADAPVVVDNYDSLYTATIVNGKVQITFNVDKCEQYADDCMLPCRVGPDPVFWEGLDEDVVDLVACSYGEGINPMLSALTSAGHVAFMSITDAIFTGDMFCSGPLQGFENVKTICENCEYDCAGVLTDKGTDREMLVKECEMGGYYYVDDFEIVIARDWNIHANSESADFHVSGQLVHDWEFDADGTEGYSRRYHFFAGGEKYVFELSIIYGEQLGFFTLLEGDWPLIMDKQITFERDFFSRMAD